MSSGVARLHRLERLLEELLRYGTSLATGVTAVGTVLSLTGTGSNTAVIAWGIACFILLPVLRVIVMLAVFVWVRDYRYSIIAIVVLLTIFAAFVIGARGAT